MYTIKTIKSIDDIDSCEVASISIYNWGGEYRPTTTAKLGYISDQSFIVKLSCEETNPLATVMPPYSHVCIDSCLEFFANFKPNIKNSPYINFEANCLGTLCCEFGENGGLRPNFKDNNIPYPVIEVFKTDTTWGVIITIDFDILRAVYGDIDFKQGDIIKGSFYKCGDKTDHPHYGSYTKINTPNPSFHQPDTFADMIIAG